MKVKIGPYIRWIGPYQIAEFLLGNPIRTVVSLEVNRSRRERWADSLGDWLATGWRGGDSWLAKFCEWVHSKRRRQVYVHIDPWDTWSMDETLRLIIAPMLRQLKATKHGSPFVEDADVPEHLRSTSAPPVENEWDLDDNHHLRYEWLLDELIWVFSTDHQQARDQFYDHSAGGSTLVDKVKNIRVDHEGLDQYDARVQNAYRLFGKYYQTLWD